MVSGMLTAVVVSVSGGGICHLLSLLQGWFTSLQRSGQAHVQACPSCIYKLEMIETQCPPPPACKAAIGNPSGVMNSLRTVPSGKRL